MLDGSNSATYLLGALTLNGGVTLNIDNSTNKVFTFNTATSNSSTSTLIHLGNGNGTLNLGNASNFTGNIQAGWGSSSASLITFSSLSDAVGAGNLQVGGIIGPQTGTFRLTGDAGPLTLNNRKLEFLNSAFAGSMILEDANTLPANAWVINTNVVTGFAGFTRALVLQGANTGANAMNGMIANTGNAAGVVSITKANGGNWTLTGANTSTGATSVSGGILALGDGNATGALSPKSAISVSSGATLNFNQSDTVTQGIDFSSAGISGAGIVRQSGSGTLVFNAANTYSGATNITAGTLQLGDGGSNGSLAPTSTINISSGAFFAVKQNDTVTQGVDFSTAALAGAGGVKQTGTGTLVLNIANGYSGTTNIDSGTINVQHNAALGNTTGNTVIAPGAALELQGNLTALAEPITVSGVGVASGGAIRNVSGTNTISSLVTLGSSGVFFASVAGQLNFDVPSGNAITGAGQNLILGGAANISVADPIATTTGGLTKQGTGTVTLQATNTYSGATTIAAGTLVLAGGDAIPDANTVNLSTAGAKLTLSSSETIAVVTGIAGTDIALGANTLTLGNVTNYTLDSLIAGSGGQLTKVGSGAVTLTAASTYSGVTKINSGSLLVDGSLVSTINVNSGGTLGGTGTINAPVLVNAGGSLAPGHSPGILGVNNLTFSAGSSFTVELLIFRFSPEPFVCKHSYE